MHLDSQATVSDFLAHWQRLTGQNPVARLCCNTQRQPTFFIFPPVYTSCCFDRQATGTLSMWAHQIALTRWLTALLSPPPLPSPSPISDLRNQPYRRADAVRRSVRRRFDDQNLRPVNNGEVVMWRGSGACAGRGRWGWRKGVCVWERGRRMIGCGAKADERKMTSVVATIERSMYIYYIRIRVIPCLWYRSSFSRWRTEFKETCLKGRFRTPQTSQVPELIFVV